MCDKYFELDPEKEPSAYAFKYLLCRTKGKDFIEIYKQDKNRRRYGQWNKEQVRSEHPQFYDLDAQKTKLDNKINSIVVPPGMQLQIFEKPYYNGDRTTLYAGIYKSIDMNNKISSLAYMRDKSLGTTWDDFRLRCCTGANNSKKCGIFGNSGQECRNFMANYCKGDKLNNSACQNYCNSNDSMGYCDSNVKEWCASADSAWCDCYSEKYDDLPKGCSNCTGYRPFNDRGNCNFTKIDCNQIINATAEGGKIYNTKAKQYCEATKPGTPDISEPTVPSKPQQPTQEPFYITYYWVIILFFIIIIFAAILGITFSFI